MTQAKEEAATEAATEDRFLRNPEVARMTGYTRYGLDRAVRDGIFPAPVKIGSRAVAWSRLEVLAWMDQRKQERDARRAALAKGSEV